METIVFLGTDGKEVTLSATHTIRDGKGEFIHGIVNGVERIFLWGWVFVTLKSGNIHAVKRGI